MFEIMLTEEFSAICPNFIGAAVTAIVENAPTSDKLQAEMDACVVNINACFNTESVKERAGIKATRRAYRAAGKDPSRYRPACEQLARRVLQGKGLYVVDTLVDIGNLVSLSCGYSTAALDAEHIVGSSVTLGLGHVGEPYEGIGRGALNIENLPVYRDAEGAFATPTSDSTRTMVSPSTRKFLLLINGYDGDRVSVEHAATLTRQLLVRYADGHNVRTRFYGCLENSQY